MKQTIKVGWNSILLFQTKVSAHVFIRVIWDTYNYIVTEVVKITYIFGQVTVLFIAQ